MEEDKGKGRGRGRGRGSKGRGSNQPKTPAVTPTTSVKSITSPTGSAISLASLSNVAPLTSCSARNPITDLAIQQSAASKPHLASSQPVLSQPFTSQSRPTHLALPKTTFSKPEETIQTPSRGRGDRSTPLEGASYVPKIATGTTGNQVILQSNYFKLPSTTDWILFQHRVDFAPEEDSLYSRKKLLKLHNAKLGAYIFDGTIIYTSNRLPSIMELLSIRETDGEKIKITIKFVKEVPKDDYYYLQFFNLIMRKCLEFLNLQLVGRDFYDVERKVDISQFKLELWPGYFTSIREHERNILMCAEITHKVMRQETLLDIWLQCLEVERKPQEAYINLVKGTVVLTGYNNNTYSIKDVNFELKPSDTFQLQSGEKISYKDYYKNRYQLKITYEDQPLLVAKPKQKIRTMNTKLSDQVIYLVPEFCRATGLTDKMRSNFKLMNSLAAYTRISPETRINKLLQFNKRLCSEPNVIKELNNWNLKLENKLIEIPARILPCENIVFGSRSSVTEQEADWSKDIRKYFFVNCKPLEKWILVQTSNTKVDCENFLQYLMKAANGMGFKINRPEIIILRDDRTGTYVDTIENYMSKRNTQFVFCVLSHNRTERYNAIKHKCCVDRPIPSQVIVQKNLSKGFSVATKVAIQMNCKMGGIPWFVDIPLSGLMVIGFDACHGKQSNNYGAIVASLNNNLSRYISAVSRHTTGEELSNDISTHICKFVTVYRSLNNKLPDRIVIYRDGVGEGQIEQVYQHEIKEIRKRLQVLYEKVEVKLAVIIVNKRINTRLFYRNTNPPPGTVVDDVITNPVKYDFFIVSQHVKQGTVTPTLYSVIDDNIGLNADKMQRLTYKLTHMYFNWTGTVRVPAPCQYAHKLAYLISENIKTIPNVRLEQLLYFL
ncbi:hypothetical protein M0802_001440 [Mischocyttarus mexicanus]|nr:hypothetical protein M0802_001440 [Mischocyttarus mexicanus]